MDLKFIQIAVAPARPEGEANPDVFGLTADGQVYRFRWQEECWARLPMGTAPDATDDIADGEDR